MALMQIFVSTANYRVHLHCNSLSAVWGKHPQAAHWCISCCSFPSSSGHRHLRSSVDAQLGPAFLSPYLFSCMDAVIMLARDEAGCIHIEVSFMVSVTVSSTLYWAGQNSTAECSMLCCAIQHSANDASILYWVSKDSTAVASVQHWTTKTCNDNACMVVLLLCSLRQRSQGSWLQPSIP